MDRDAMEFLTGLFYLAGFVIAILMVVAQFQLFAIRKSTDRLVLVHGQLIALVDRADKLIALAEKASK